MAQSFKLIFAALVTMSSVAVSLPASGREITFIELYPKGTSDGPLPTVWISTRKIEWTSAFQFNDLVPDELYKKVKRLIRTKICDNQLGHVDKKIGPPATIILEERSYTGGVSFSCRIEGPAVDELVNGIDRLYKARKFESRAIDIWKSFLERQH